MNYTDKEYQQISSQIKINRDSLDEEAINQPNLFFHASEAFALAVSVKDAKKQQLELTEAQLDKDIREEAAADEKKVTEPWVKQEIIRSQKYQRAAKEHIEATLTSNRWSALKEAYKQRADMLKVLQNLYCTGHFGEITGISERKEARERFDNKRRS